MAEKIGTIKASECSRAQLNFAHLQQEIYEERQRGNIDLV